jgi:hypothetical protein
MESFIETSIIWKAVLWNISRESGSTVSMTKNKKIKMQLALKKTSSTLKRNFTVLYFCGSFLSSRIQIVNPETDPGAQLNPDPQHC